MKRENSIVNKLKASSLSLFNEIYGYKKYRRYKITIKRIQKSEWDLQTVGRIKALKIEVRSSEKPHNLPHFHVTSPGKIDAFYTISPVAFYKGKISGNDNKAVIELAEANRDMLVNMWNDFHGYRIKVS